jgi:hypothetical protein
MTLSDTFTRIFREEHREVRDGLLDLVQAFQDRDSKRAQALLDRVAQLTGPHFRYEEESLYPGLVEIFGPEYIDKLLGDHDAAIGTAKELVDVAQKDSLSAEDAATAIRWVRSILPHVSDCDGLSIMVERLADQKIKAIFTARDRAQKESLDLLTWAAKVRGRPAAVPA